MEIKNMKSMDPNLLLSIVNMKLRDEFENLEDLLRYYNLKESDLTDKIKEIGYHYCKETNQFIGC
ncbi:DUF4250 domain-containing protein [uncultured Ilyobacter sp.]|uniref:DUF4250 domain-containing protein n=1 Tax=uncultured Ilyobacter sp. TaxID=544433 RepID=UPI0029C7A67A|nr:DUF4250 domain-containing protein [uncultured Ilyobacter sp.]